VRDAVVNRDERLPPEERERAGGRGGDLERTAHAGGLGVADVGEVGGGDAGPATPHCDAAGSRRGGRIGGEQEERKLETCTRYGDEIHRYLGREGGLFSQRTSGWGEARDRAEEARMGRLAREAESPRLECFTYHFFSPLCTF
jgi:hypothetical protein